MFMFDTKMATVRPYLLLGAAPHEHDYALLRGAGVTHILQVGSELRSSFPDRFEYLRVSIDDAEQEDIIRQLPRCFKFIDDARRRDEGCADAVHGAVHGADGGGAVPSSAAPAVVLVHCMAGMSRSASVVVAYLMGSERLSYTEAFKQAKAARPCIYPNLGFLLQLWEWEAGGCDLDSWTGWNKGRFAEGLAEYRRAQAAAGLHPAVRVRLPLSPRSASAISTGSSGGGGSAGIGGGVSSVDRAVPAVVEAAAAPPPAAATDSQTTHPAAVGGQCGAAADQSGGHREVNVAAVESGSEQPQPLGSVGSSDSSSTSGLLPLAAAVVASPGLALPLGALAGGVVRGAGVEAVKC